MDAFFVSVEEALNPKLKGKPVIVGGDPGGRGVVTSASYKAREYGVRAAMPLAQAKKLCPKGIFLKGSHRLYSTYSRRIMEILERYTPAVEQVSVDEAYMDLTGCERAHKADAVTIAERIHQAISDEVGVPCSIGIAQNKVTAKIAANMAKPNGMLYVRPGREADFLAPLPIGKMPGVGPSTEKELYKLGVHKIGDLARFPVDTLEKVFGKRASWLSEKAAGRGGSEVSTDDDDAKSIGRELTYAADTSDPEMLEATLSYLSESVGQRLRRAGLVFCRVTVKLRYADFNTYTRAKTIANPASGTGDIYRAARDILHNLYTRRAAVRLIGVTVSCLAEPPKQTTIFDAPASLSAERLTRQVDEAKERFGFHSAMTARSYVFAKAMEGRKRVA
ncbi:MAG: DNA polymerase IV [Nitrospinae bacterium]|nr:DNA polymerase IV [Nitrospinota bacterium]